jgi:ribosomal protein S18 acetylase RimI-like enzyme
VSGPEPAPLSIERATIATWPARITEERRGWRLLAAGGVTGRVNAAWPIEWTGGDLDAAITEVEAWYASLNLPPRFKLTEGAIAPDDLPVVLTKRGYAPTMHTLVMTRAVGGEAEADRSVVVFDEMPDVFDRALSDSTPDPDELEERRAIAQRAPRPAAFAVIEWDGRPAAVGMTALAEDLAGLFLMRTIPEARRQGFAKRVLRTLLARAELLGAAHAFLQVEAENRPAVSLYETEGFKTLTSYRFWRKAP